MMSNLMEKRRKAGISRVVLAEKAGVNLRTLEGYEQGKRDLYLASYATVDALAKVIGCKPSDFFKDTN